MNDDLTRLAHQADQLAATLQDLGTRAFAKLVPEAYPTRRGAAWLAEVIKSMEACCGHPIGEGAPAFYLAEARRVLCGGCFFNREESNRAGELGYCLLCDAPGESRLARLSHVPGRPVVLLYGACDACLDDVIYGPGSAGAQA